MEDVKKIMLNSTEHDVSMLIKTKNADNKDIISFFKLWDDLFILLKNVKMPTIVGILTFLSKINFILSWDEHEFLL